MGKNIVLLVYLVIYSGLRYGILFPVKLLNPSSNIFILLSTLFSKEYLSIIKISLFDSLYIWMNAPSFALDVHATIKNNYSDKIIYLH